MPRSHHYDRSARYNTFTIKRLPMTVITPCDCCEDKARILFIFTRKQKTQERKPRKIEKKVYLCEKHYHEFLDITKYFK